MTDRHPNFAQQLADMKEAKTGWVTLEALALNVRHDIDALLKAAGFELDIDTWGSGQIVLRHLTERGYDFELEFETGEIV